MRTSLALFAIALILITTAASEYSPTSQTVYVDDADLAMAFVTDVDSENSRWTAVDSTNIANSCGTFGCWSTSIDASQTYKGTWHEGVDLATAAYRFTGTGADVYLVFRNLQDALTNLTFLVDGEVRGSLLKMGTGNGSWIYNYNAFSIGGLDNTEHELVISNGSPSAIVLDYMSYTKLLAPVTQDTILGETETDAPTSVTPVTTTLSQVRASPSATATTTQTPFISHNVAIGLAVAAVPVIAVLIGGILLCRRRRRRRSGQVESDEIDLGASEPNASYPPSPVPFRLPTPSPPLPALPPPPPTPAPPLARSMTQRSFASTAKAPSTIFSPVTHIGQAFMAQRIQATFRGPQDPFPPIHFPGTSLPLAKKEVTLSVYEPRPPRRHGVGDWAPGRQPSRGLAPV